MMRINALKKRLPSSAEIYAVFCVAVVFVYSWSIRGFLFKLPSFLFYFSAWDILAVFSYVLAVALLESLIVVFGLVALCFVLPGKLLKQGFEYKGFLILLVSAVAMILLQKELGNTLPDVDVLYVWMWSIILVAGMLVLLFHNVLYLQNLVRSIVDGLKMLAYIYIPIGMIAVLVVIVRNIF